MQAPTSERGVSKRVGELPPNRSGRSSSSRRSAGKEAYLQNSKFRIWPRGAAKFLNFEFCGVGSQSSPSSRRVGRRRRFEARGRKPTCKIQNSKFGRGERPNFKFMFLRRRISIIAVVASRRVGRRRRVESRREEVVLQNFEFCDIGSQPSPSSRLPSCLIAFLNCALVYFFMFLIVSILFIVV